MEDLGLEIQALNTTMIEIRDHSEDMCQGLANITNELEKLTDAVLALQKDE
jgi:adenylosuccinate lyase